MRTSANVQGLRTGPVTFVSNTCLLRLNTFVSRLNPLGPVGSEVAVGGRRRRPICYQAVRSVRTRLGRRPPGHPRTREFEPSLTSGSSLFLVRCNCRVESRRPSEGGRRRSSSAENRCPSIRSRIPLPSHDPRSLDLRPVPSLVPGHGRNQERYRRGCELGGEPGSHQRGASRPHAEGTDINRRSRSAANARAALMSSLSRSGNSARISSSLIPEAR